MLEGVLVAAVFDVDDDTKGFGLAVTAPWVSGREAKDVESAGSAE